MRDNRGDEVRLRHILDAILEIETYLENSDLEEFSANSMKKYASIKQLEIIGEAATHVSKTLKDKYSEVEWREIIGLRNILIHEYFGVDENIIFGIISKDIPVLKSQISHILNEL